MKSDGIYFNIATSVSFILILHLFPQESNHQIKFPESSHLSNDMIRICFHLLLKEQLNKVLVLFYN